MKLSDIQRHLGIPADGILGPQTLEAIAKAIGMADEQWNISQRGVDLIKKFEGLRLKAYQDTGGVWTIGYGSTKGVKPGQVITEAQAETLLRSDLSAAESDVRRLAHIVTQGQYDSLVSFVFNLGAGQFQTSTLRRLHNEGDYAGAEKQFLKWVFDDGVKLAGLVKRRLAEAELYRS